jgi:hypothetical protein
MVLLTKDNCIIATSNSSDDNHNINSEKDLNKIMGLFGTMFNLTNENAGYGMN